VDIFFLEPSLRHLDDAEAAEVCVCSVWSDERPARGFAALLDWRLGGRLSALMKSGFVTGESGEKLLVPGKPHVPFEKVLVLGLGARAAFGEGAFREAVLSVGAALSGLRVRRAVVELPGRANDAIDPERAVTLTLECVGGLPEHDAWWLVENPAVQKRVEQRAADERRRARSL
jgi:hypothetical protein